VRVIRAFNKEDEEIREFTESNDKLAAYQKFVGKISGLLNPVTYILINAAVIVLIQVGAVKVNTGDLTQGQVVALYNYMSQILVELIKLANLIVTITKALACEKRIDEVFEIVPAMTEGSLQAMPESPVAVEFRNVSLRYKGAGDNSLSDISFTVHSGQTVGIIGGTGAGKSSLVNLIPRFYDATEGQVFLFGSDIREYSFEALRKNIAVVLQRAQLFRGSIQDNITMGKPETAQDAINEALDVSQAQEFVSGKEGGLDAKIEQGGKNLSGGQKQRLTIARALVKKPQILILDDSASALDYATDFKLRKGLQALSYSPTVFIISQRASSILHADLILVLDDGRLVGAGSHSQLIESCKVYREIYSSQYQGGTRHEA
jgi:ABC-type multidrug transport system fused ATPase/permease subunit